MAEATFKEIPEIFEVNLLSSAGVRGSYIYFKVELGEALTARTESLCKAQSHLRRVIDY